MTQTFYPTPMNYMANYSGNNFSPMPYQTQFYPNLAQQNANVTATPIANVNNTSMNNRIVGRIVSNTDEIMPNEVPMDGSVGLFPQSDYSCIVAKAWNSDGTIKTVKFVPTVETNINNEDFSATVMHRLDKIEKMVSKSNGNCSCNNNNNKLKTFNTKSNNRELDDNE